MGVMLKFIVNYRKVAKSGKSLKSKKTHSIEANIPRILGGDLEWNFMQ